MGLKEHSFGRAWWCASLRCCLCFFALLYRRDPKSGRFLVDFVAVLVLFDVDVVAPAVAVLVLVLFVDATSVLFNRGEKVTSLGSGRCLNASMRAFKLFVPCSYSLLCMSPVGLVLGLLVFGWNVALGSMVFVKLSLVFSASIPCL